MTAPAASRTNPRPVDRDPIPLERVQRLVQELLCCDSLDDLRGFSVDRGAVIAEMYARDQDGHRFAVGGEIAVDRIHIPDRLRSRAMPAHFIQAHHAGLDVTKTLPASALRHLSGWVPVDAEKVIPDVPSSTVAHVLAEVADDPVKAAAALKAESGRTTPRSTLVDALNRIIDEETD